jgi:hypothetical protein
MMDKCKSCPVCGADYERTLIKSTGECAGNSVFGCLKRQLAAANERANTYLGEMVRLQERIDTAAESEAKREAETFEMAREAWEVRSHSAKSDSIPCIADACDILDTYFATGEKEG